MMAVPGDNVTALHMNNEINIFGMYTSIKTTQFVTYPMIQDAIKAVEKKVENEDAFWRNLAIGAIATVALAAAAVAVVCTGGAALAAFALAGAAVGTGLVTAGASIADYKSGSARSTGDFLVQMVTGGAIGAVAGAAIYMIAPVLPGASSMMSAGICAEFGISSAAAGTALTYGIMGGGYLSLAGSTAFAADQAFALGSGESILLDTVFRGNQDAYDTALVICDTLTAGYLDMSMQYRMTSGNQTANGADDTTDETRQENKKNVNMDASENNADDTNGTGPKNSKTSTNTSGNAADDAETSGTSGKKSGVYLEEGESKTSTAKSKRLQYMGKTPGKGSKTGKAVIARMKEEGKIREVRGEMQFQASNGKWYPISEADMAHRTDAVSWWNSVGRNYGPKSPKVREFMLDPNNYYLEHYSINRSQGAKLGQNYLPPLE